MRKQPYIPYNLGHNKVHGIYGRLRQQFTLINEHRLGYQISYNYLKPRLLTAHREHAKYTLETLRHQFIIGLDYGYRHFSLHLENRYIKREIRSGYDVMGLHINYQLKPFSFYVNITNILNTEYIEAGAVPMPSRWFTLGVRYRWEKD